MYSRIRDKIKEITGKLDEAVGESDWYEAASALNDLEDLMHDEALLTAEPEPCQVQAEPEFPSHPGGYSGGESDPCEDSDHVIDQLEKITGVDRTEESGPFACIDRANGKTIVDAYASQVADKRSEDLRAQSQKDSAIAFVKGAKWWEYHQTKGTMWQSDQAIASEEAEKRYKYKPTLDDLFPADAFRRIVEALSDTEPKLRSCEECSDFNAQRNCDICTKRSHFVEKMI